MSFLAATIAVRMILPFLTGDVEVHEWGVVRFDASGITAVGLPPGEYSSVGPVPFEYGTMPPLVDAPVIFFHGSGFTGDFVVEIPEGRATEIYPEEGMRTTGDSIIWQGIEVIDSPLVLDGDDRRGISDFVWENAVFLWRGVDAGMVRTGTGLEEGFLYYECEMSPLSCFRYPGLLARGEGLPQGVDRILMFLKPDGDFQEMYMVDPLQVFTLLEVDEIGCYQRQRVIGVLREWAGYRLNPDEVEAMWSTWEEFVTSGEWMGDALIVFPLPDETVQRISTLTLITHQDHDVSYRRFFLGMAPVNW
ncbi:MAG: hypothetical protein JXA64_10255 [Candidatus Fermentibacteraceae bacterium]|nr:hypothetical protein [Candidatus Fermentibacteraceae bacterium]